MRTAGEPSERAPERSADGRRWLAVVALMLVGVVLTIFTPAISLTTRFADGVVRLTDTATWGQMPVLVVVGVVVVVSRPGIDRRRRGREIIGLTVAMALVLAGNGELNESVVKPALGVERPNIEALATSGALGAAITNAETFYAQGDKEARRELMADRLDENTTPHLSALVRSHWVHETGYSFPSGHTTAAVTLATVTAGLGLRWLRGWRRGLAVFLVPAWAVAVAHTRVLLEVHTAADVIAGTVAGFLWGGIAYLGISWVVERPRAAADD